MITLGRRPAPAGNASRRQFLVYLLVATSFLVGCGNDGEDGNAHQSGQGRGGPGSQAAAGQPGRRGPGGEQSQAIPVAVRAAKSGNIASYYSATATLEAEREAEILARVTGTVASLSAEEGDRVATGATLLGIGNEEYSLRLKQARARTANIRSRFERVKSMLDEELISQEEFQTVQSELAVAEAEEGLARLNLSYTTVAAPFSGRVTQRLVAPGQNVAVGTPLFVMADFDPLLARVHVPSREFKNLSPDQPVELVLDSDGQRLSGRITLVSPVIDPGSGTIKVTIEVPDYPTGTRPGDFAEVRIVTEEHRGTVLVPRSAVVTDKGETFVYVAKAAADSAATAERRLVELGFSNDERTEILSGVDAGESVVVKGQRSLKAGAPLKILEDESGGAQS